MAFEKAKAYLNRFGYADRIIETEHSSATVAEAAEALGCAEAMIAKTLSFLQDDRPVLILADGLARVDNRKYKDQFGTKAKMLTADQLTELVGHAPGGVCPFAVNEGVRTYLDISLRRFETVFPACGSSNSAIELTLPELERFSNAEAWIDVCKGWQ